MTSPVSASARASCVESQSEAADACVYVAPVCSETESQGVSSDAPISNDAAPASPEPWGLRFCREADTVVEGYLCQERVVVSDACRKPNNAFDASVCDEPRMHALQDDVVRRTLSILKALFTELTRR